MTRAGVTSLPRRAPLRRLVTVRPLTEDEIRASFVNGSADELEHLALPVRIMLTEWENVDVVGWRDPKARQRGYLLVERDGEVQGIVVRAAETTMPRGRSAQCSLCHTLQPADQVSLFSARRAGAAGERGDSVGTYICADLSCSDTVHLPTPLAPLEVRARGGARAAGLARRAAGFVSTVLGD